MPLFRHTIKIKQQQQQHVSGLVNYIIAKTIVTSSDDKF